MFEAGICKPYNIVLYGLSFIKDTYGSATLR